MRSDRYTKIVLTVIAVCLSILMLSEVGITDLTAQAEATVAPPPRSALQGMEKPRDEAGPVRAPTATLPLRWRISWATEYDSSDTFCGTAIVVTNTTNSTVDVEVEWFNYGGSSLLLRPLSISGLYQRIWITGDNSSTGEINFRPFAPDDDADMAAFLGYATVNSDDPRIQVAAFQYCRNGLGPAQQITSITNIPTHPVGATAEFFVAGMPAAWTPPMVTPEVPE